MQVDIVPLPAGNLFPGFYSPLAWSLAVKQRSQTPTRVLRAYPHPYGLPLLHPHPCLIQNLIQKSTLG